MNNKYSWIGSCPPAPSGPAFRPVRRLSVLAAAFVSAFLFVQALSAQVSTGTVEGRVLNPTTGDYVLNARVRVDGTGREAMTDSTGAFRITGVPAGFAAVTVSYPGVPSVTKQVEIGANVVSRQDFEVGRGTSAGEHTVTLDAYTVEATREMDANVLAINEQRYAANIKNVIAADAFGDVTEGNIGEFLKRLPGVGIFDSSGDISQIMMRGFDGEFTPITVDGLATPSASSSATSASRMNNLEQISISNVSRVEVIKSPIPSMPAHFLGGSVNLIMKSSFERSKPQLSFRGTVQFTGDDYSWSKTPGPGTPKTRKLRPGYEFSYINPVTENFGFTISSIMSDQYARLQGPVSTWEFNPAQGGSETSPFLRTLRSTEDSRGLRRESHAASIDWRPWEPLTLTFGFRQGVYELFATPNRMQFNTGNRPVLHGPTFTEGRTGAGSIDHRQIWTGKTGTTNQYTMAGKYQKDQWRVDFSASTSESDLAYPDLEWGFFRGATTRVRPSLSPTLTYRDVNSPNLPNIELRTGSGQLLDWKDLSNYEIRSVAADQRNATDMVDQINLNARREFFWRGRSGAIQVGGTYQKRTVDRYQWEPTWTFVGADGVAATADDNAGQFVDPILTGINAGFNTPSDIQWPDLRALYALYLERPNYFVLQQPAAYISTAESSERISEAITAAYIQGEMRFFENRMLVVGGVRFEKTDLNGAGLLRDRDAIYQRDANGEFVRTPGGALIPITNDPLERAKLEYKIRGLTTERSYDDFFPSVAVTVNLKENLLLRLGYGRTMGRPEFSNIVPNIDIDEDVETGLGVVRARNPGLKPWTADNYDVSLEYYTKSGGVLSAGVFYKEVTGAFGSETSVVDQALIEEHNLDPIYEGWDFVSTYNVGEATKVKGYELNLSQSLDFLHEWTEGLSVFGNVTRIQMDGPIAVQRPATVANWGFSYSRRKFALGLAWSYVGGVWITQSGSDLAIGEGGRREQKTRISLDLTSEYRITPHWSVFFNAKNLTNSLRRQNRLSFNTPAYSNPQQWTELGAKLSAGFKVKF